MGSIRGKLALCFKVLFQSGEHIVEGSGKHVDLIIAGSDVKASGKIAALADRLGIARDLFDRQERAAGDYVAAEQRESCEHRQQPQRKADDVIKDVDAFVL